MSCSFNGITKIISINNGVTSITVQNIYSLWKLWAATDDNLKYLPAFSVLGGDPTVGGKFLGTTYFLENGWKIRPMEGNHTLNLEGNLFSRDGSSPMVQTLGNYNVLVNLQTSNIIDTVSTTGGSGDFPTVSEIVSGVSASFSADMSRLLEMYILLGLDPTKPLIVAPNARVAGTIQQSINSNPNNQTTTVTRTQ